MARLGATWRRRRLPALARSAAGTNRLGTNHLESPAGETLLRISETARTATQAWQLILAYKVPLDGRFEATEDWSAFRAGRRLSASAAERIAGWNEPGSVTSYRADRGRRDFQFPLVYPGRIRRSDASTS